MMLKWLTALLAISGAVSTAAAANITIELPENQEVSTDQQLYKCGEMDVAVTYYNAGDISLAKLEMEDQTIVASNVMSGSGARYAGSIYIWWTKGDAADLYNLMEDPDQSKPVSCKQQ